MQESSLASRFGGKHIHSFQAGQRPKRAATGYDVSVTKLVTFPDIPLSFATFGSEDGCLLYLVILWDRPENHEHPVGPASGKLHFVLS
jgi:hypothetical protein